MYSHVIWDWNGTLLDDVTWSVSVLNSMLTKRNMPAVAGIEAYHRVFGFPVRDYYRRVGFDFEAEPYEVLAAEYVEQYYGYWQAHCTLHEGAEETVKAIDEMGVTQIVLSASRTDLLLSQTDAFDVLKCFDRILGISDFYAGSKVDMAKDYIQTHHVERGLFIGDTVHDAEVAAAIGCDCILIARGHQSKETLFSCGVPVIEDIRQVLSYLK